jgi:site-specific recombinase XerD
MGRFMIPYLRIKHGKAYWEPNDHYVVEGVLTPVPKSLRAQPLGREGPEAASKALELDRMLKEWRAGKNSGRVIERGSMHWMAVEYYKDEMFTALSPKSQKEYKRVLEKEILPIIGDLPADEITRAAARDFYQGMRQKGKDRLTEYTMMVARRLFHFGKNIDAVTENPFTEMGIKKSRPREMIWEETQIRDFMKKSLEMGKPSMWLAMLIGSTIGTDTQTTRLLPLNGYDGAVLKFTRNKNKVKIAIPVTAMAALKTALDDFKAKSSSMQFIVSEATGKPYSEFHFCDVFREVADAAGIPKALQFKDLRRAAVMNLVRAGNTAEQIASIVGWEVKYCTEIIDHYLPASEKTAGEAMGKLVSFRGALSEIDKK